MINLKEECLFLIHENRVLEAQSLAFQHFGNLSQAKEFIESLHPITSHSNIVEENSKSQTSFFDEIIHLVEGKMKLIAVKTLKDNTNLGLKEAKDLIDLIEANIHSKDILTNILNQYFNTNINLSSSPIQQASQNSEFGTKVSIDTILDLIRQGKKIEAVKLVKDTDGFGLKESKDIVDAIQEKYYKY